MADDVVDVHRPPPVSAATVSLVLAATTPGPSPAAEPAVTAAVGTDPGFAARVLAVANRAPFGGARSVAGLHQAVAELGPPVVRALAAGTGAGAIDPAELAEHHRHARTVAAAARLLAPLGGADPDEAFAAGLLHDLGELLLPGPDPHRPRTWAASVASHRDQLRAESGRFGTDHALAGAEHLLECRVPDVVADAVADHHEPYPTSAPTTVVVAAADELTGTEPGRTRALDRLGLAPPARAELRRQVAAELAHERPLVHRG